MKKGETHVEVLGPKAVTALVPIRGHADGIDPRVVQLAVGGVHKHLKQGLEEYEVLRDDEIGTFAWTRRGEWT